jgi:ribonuclease E
VALAVLRALEDQLLRDARSSLTAVTTTDVALYILNNKRSFVTDMERRYGIVISVQASERMQGANCFDGLDGEEEEALEEAGAPAEREEGGRRSRRRRRRGRRDDRAEDRPPHRMGAERARFAHNGEAEEGGAPDDAAAVGEPQPQDDLRGEIDEPPGTGEQPAIARSDEEGEERKPRRRRGRRGGRRRDREGRPAEYRDDAAAPEADVGNGTAAPEAAHVAEAVAEAREPQEDRPGESPAQVPPGPEDRAQPVAVGAAAPEPATPSWQPASDRLGNGGEPQAPRHAEPPAPAEDTPARREPEPAHAEPAAEPAPGEPSRPARKGWWQRRFSGE